MNTRTLKPAAILRTLRYIICVGNVTSYCFRDPAVGVVTYLHIGDIFVMPLGSKYAHL